MKFILRYRRNCKERYWTSKEFNTLTDMKWFLEKIVEETEEPSIEMKLYKIDGVKYTREDLGF